MKNLVLIGMPGSGKTRLGQALARRFSLPLVDTDAWVEKQAGATIPELFASKGEEFFRDMEARAVRWAAEQTGTVVATGGGVVLREENMARLRETGVVFFRDRKPEAIAGEDHRGRPLVGTDSQRIFQLYQVRLPLYQRYAHYIVPHTDTLDEAEKQIAEIFAREVKRL